MIRCLIILSLILAPVLGYTMACKEPFANFSAEWLSAGKFSPNDFSPVPMSQLKDLKQGNPGPGLFTATLNGQTVIGKRATFGKLKEGAWMRELNRLGIGVRLHGITRLADGDFFFVMEHVPGVNTNQPAKVAFRESTVGEMRRQFEILAENGIIPWDLQYQVTRDGRVVLVDTELFEIKSTFGNPERAWKIFAKELREHFQIVP